MAIEVFKEPLYRRYYAPLSSLTCLYILCYLFLLIFLPLFIAYNSSSFWLKENILYEQPAYQYSYQSLFRFNGQDNGNQINLFWSTSPLINQLYSSSLRSSTIKSIEIDENRDGLTDRLEINLLIPLSDEEIITSFDCLIFSTIRLQQKVKYIYDAVSHLSMRSGGINGMNQIYFDGNLVIRQSAPFIARGGFISPYPDDESLFPALTNTLSASRVSFHHLLSQSAARNFSIDYQNIYNYYEGSNNSPSNYCNVSITLRIPLQPIIYSPAVSEVVKFAWIQYLAIFIIVSFLFHHLNSFIFSHQLLRTYAVSDIVVKKFE